MTQYKLWCTSRLFKPEKFSTKLGVSLYNRAKIQTSTIEWSTSGIVFLIINIHHKTAREEVRRQLHKNAASNLEQVLAATPHKTPTVRPPASYHENYPS